MRFEPIEGIRMQKFDIFCFTARCSVCRKSPTAILLYAIGSTRESEEMGRSNQPQKVGGATRSLVSEGRPVSSDLKAQRHKMMRDIVLKSLRKSASKLEARP